MSSFQIIDSKDFFFWISRSRKTKKLNDQRTFLRNNYTINCYANWIILIYFLKNPSGILYSERRWQWFFCSNRKMLLDVEATNDGAAKWGLKWMLKSLWLHKRKHIKCLVCASKDKKKRTCWFTAKYIFFPYPPKLYAFSVRKRMVWHLCWHAITGLHLFFGYYFSLKNIFDDPLCFCGSWC